MRNTSVRWKFVAPLLAALAPLLVLTALAVRVVDSRLTARIEQDLRNTAELEASRIGAALADQSNRAQRMAAGEHVGSLVSAIAAARLSDSPRSVEIGGVDGFDLIDAASPTPLNQLAQRMQEKSWSTDRNVLGIVLVDADGISLGGTVGACGECSPDLVREVLSTGDVHFAPAIRDSSGTDRLPVLAPILGGTGQVIGVLLVDFSLAPVLELVKTHERLGETSEAHLAQRRPNGDAIFITPLRFDQGAAFVRSVPASRQVPIVLSLDRPETDVVHAKDYRDKQSILAIQTIPLTGWGLVVKVDSAETLAPVAELRMLLFASVGIASLLMTAAWAAVINPLVARLQDTATAARRVAKGDLDSRIGDPRGDEIGVMAASIDQLASDLADDKAERSNAEEQLRYRASHDGLTGIVNRRFATDWIENALADNAPGSVGLLFGDVDGFKEINDTFGHDVGDLVLCRIAEVLVDIAGQDALVARWGGDEFLIGLKNVDPNEAQRLATKVRASLKSPLQIDTRELHVSLSLGVASGESGLSADRCIRAADASMYEEKRTRRLLSDSQSNEIQRRVRGALDERRLIVVYQPIMALHPDMEPTLCSLEALARIAEPGVGLVGAAEFIHQVETTMLAVEVDRHVMRTAIAQFAESRRNGDIGPEVTMSINLSPASLSDPTLPTFTRAQLEEAGVPADLVIVELSERCLHIDPVVARGLQGIGLLLGIDDFGVLGSNLDRLVDLDVDVLKVDRRWVGLDPTASSPAEESVMKAVVALCTLRQIAVVAEGIETVDHELTLHRLGINRAQGFLYGSPERTIAPLTSDRTSPAAGLDERDKAITLL